MKKIKISFIIFISIAVGIIIDRFFISFSFLELDPKVSFIDAASLLVSIIIALMIPLFISKLIEEKQGLKALIIDEFRELIKILDKVKSIISDAHERNSFIPKDRDKIIYTFYEAELKVNCIKAQLEVGFKAESDQTSQLLVDLLFKYQDYVTGGELMTSGFITVDDRFYRENNTEFSKVETGLKTLIQKVYKY